MTKQLAEDTKVVLGVYAVGFLLGLAIGLIF